MRDLLFVTEWLNLTNVLKYDDRIHSSLSNQYANYVIQNVHITMYSFDFLPLVLFFMEGKLCNHKVTKRALLITDL